MKNLLVDIIKAPDYFSFYELIHTDTGINNVPEDLVNVRMLSLCSRVLNYIRHELGFPISVNSGFRTSEVNRAVGGVSDSNHLYGLAFDIRPSHKSKVRYEELLSFLQTYPISEYLKEIIPYRDKGFVHISINLANLFEHVLEMVDDKSTRYLILDLLSVSTIK